jgi:hypothetical protein
MINRIKSIVMAILNHISGSIRIQALQMARGVVIVGGCTGVAGTLPKRMGDRFVARVGVSSVQYLGPVVDID